jgi:hypothetical protein
MARSAGAEWRPTQKHGTLSSSGAANSVRHAISPAAPIYSRARRPDWFDVLDAENRPVLTEREILRNLQAIVADADQLPIQEVARNSIGVLSTENRKVWSSLRSALSRNQNNESCLEVVDNALFVVCLDDAHPDSVAELCNNFLCGTYELKGGIQVGTCVNRWYDKVFVSLHFLSRLPYISFVAANHHNRRWRCRHQL